MHTNEYSIVALSISLYLASRVKGVDFPGGAVVKNPPTSAGDAGSSPGPGRAHMLRSN